MSSAVSRARGTRTPGRLRALRRLVPWTGRHADRPARSASRTGDGSEPGRDGTRRWRAGGDRRLAYDGHRPTSAANVRWGLTPNLTLNATVNPDFSQVEADADQFQIDPRQALFFAEKRPFFLDGIEFFPTPDNLVYSRRIVEPLAAVKLTGKSGGHDDRRDYRRSTTRRGRSDGDDPGVQHRRGTAGSRAGLTRGTALHRAGSMADDQATWSAADAPSRLAQDLLRSTCRRR